jgi:putative tricarboxylic transport membrane protein
MWGFIFANIIMGFIAIFLARTMAYLTLFPRGIIGPLILIFSVIGVYAGSNNIYDLWIMFGFGILGYIMIKTNFSPAGVLLGLILGPIAENGLRDLLIVSHGSPVSFVLTRPISVALLVGIGLALYFSLRPKPWEEEAEQKPGDSAD